MTALPKPIGLGAWRFNNEVIGRPFADKLYRDIFGNVSIEDFRATDHDKLVGIDVGIRFGTGQILFAQEKFLSFTALSFGTLTIEYMQNPLAGEQGDWYHLGVQLYLGAYLNEQQTGFAKWALINWASFVLLTVNRPWLFIERQNKRDGAKASFKAIKFDDIPPHAIIGKSW